MTTKIDVSSIVKEHVDSLRDAATHKVSPLDMTVMFGLPLAVGVASYLLGFCIEDKHIGTLVGAFSIFAGFLFNVIVLIYGFNPPDADTESAADQKTLLSQTFANISFSVLVSILIVVVLLLCLFAGGKWQLIGSSVFMALAANFSLSLLMVLKRIYVLLGLKFG